MALLVVAFAGTSRQTNDTETAVAPMSDTTATTDSTIETIAAADSALVNNFISQLKGIEKFAVGGSFTMMTSLLAYKNDSIAYQKIYNILQKKDENVQLFSISDLDTKNGYIVYAPIGAEVTYTEVYWNMKDGSQLLATEAWSCGPICDSQTEFTRYKDGKFTGLDQKQVIPDIEKLPNMLKPDFDPKDRSSDPVEFRYVLPNKAKISVFV